MVGIVIVSHSTKIAEGVRELALQMAKEHPIFAAGGTADDSLGSDPTRIEEAIKKANQGDGVVIMADLGSAVMSVGLVKEMLDPDLAKSVKMANAPLVEGTVAAAVEASLGSPLDKVLQVAYEARNMDKIE